MLPELYVVPVLNGTAMVEPLQMVVGNDAIANGAHDTTILLLLEVPVPQTLLPETVMGPEAALAVKFTVILLVPAPLAMAAPGGNVQLYVETFCIGATL